MIDSVQTPGQPLTVKDLIEILQKMDPATEVRYGVINQDLDVPMLSTNYSYEPVYNKVLIGWTT